MVASKRSFVRIQLLYDGQSVPGIRFGSAIFVTVFEPSRAD